MLAACLVSCATETGTVLRDNYQAALLTLNKWELQGRLNIRSNNNSDTVNINWYQDGSTYVINLSGTLGLGAVQIRGDDAGVVVEKAGEDPIAARSLEAISSDILGYAFPASELFYWIRGIPAPGTPAEINPNPDRLTATLSQADAGGRRWELQYDRYEETGGYILPGRIRLEQSPYRLTFIISDWGIVPEGEPD